MPIDHPLRIVQVITRSDTIGGANLHVCEMTAGLVAEGHKVVILVGGNGPFLQELSRKKLSYLRLQHLKREISVREDLRALLEIRAVLKRLDPDIVAAHSSKAGILTRLAARSLRLPVVFTAHGWAFTDGVPKLSAWFYLMLERLVARWSGMIMTVSDYDRQHALQHRLAPEHKLITVHCGTHDIPRHLRAEPATHPPRLAMTARFEEQKDHVTLLQGLAAVSDLPWSLDLIGDGPNRHAVERLCRELGLVSRVRFRGARLDVAESLAQSQVFLLISNWEGFPLSIIEAMRAGLPVIASDVGGIREEVLDGSTGFLIPRGDSEVLSDRLRIMLSDAVLRSQMGKASRERYESMLTFDHMYSHTLAVYEKTLAQVASSTAKSRI